MEYPKPRPARAGESASTFLHLIASFELFQNWNSYVVYIYLFMSIENAGTILYIYAVILYFNINIEILNAKQKRLFTLRSLHHL